MLGTVGADDPTGKPSAGSARNTPASTSPAPNTASSRGTQRNPGPVTSARRRPTANATTISPVSTRLATWIQPSEPLASVDHACRVRSKPSRVSACASETTT